MDGEGQRRAISGISEFSRVKKPKPSATPFTLDPRYKNACPQAGIEEG
jgi:hypothetical protein